MVDPQLESKQYITTRENHQDAQIEDDLNHLVERMTEQNVEQRTDRERENPQDEQVNDDERDQIDVEAKLLDYSTDSATKKPTINGKSNEKSEQDRTMTADINKLLCEMPLTDDTTCGFWFLKGSFFQRFANQTAYVVLYGLVGCVFTSTDGYFNGTITTIEKRFKIPSRNSGIIAVGCDISLMMVSAVLSYYAGKWHRPRLMGFGVLTVICFCILAATPHFLYGPGEDALSLTSEFGAMPDQNATMEAFEEQHTKSLCRLKGAGAECQVSEGNLTPQVLLFMAQFISGIGGSLYHTLGISYMDDNTKKSRTPALLSLSYFLRMLGPAVGYTLASFCLHIYIAPQLHPVINNKDPRWLGAWWMGWFIVGGMLFLCGVLITMFPRELPLARARRMVEESRRKQRESTRERNKAVKEHLTEALEDKLIDAVVEPKASFKDMLRTFKRLITNKTLMCNNLSSVFYLLGYTPYFVFTPKYIEIQYRQSAATASMVTGTVALVFSAVGVLLSGFVLSKYKPRARYMAAWNVIVGFLTVAGMMAYTFIGCPGNEKSVIVNIHDSNSLTAAPTCNSDCNCDYVRYAPVCGENGMTYISPCHAGCKKLHNSSKGKRTFYDCSCIPSGNYTTDVGPVLQRLRAMDLTANESTMARTLPTSMALAYPDVLLGGQATPGACPVNCFAQFVTFLAVMCFLKFIGAAGRVSNFLVSVRCVPEEDKTASMGLGIMMMAMFAFIPSPIFFGWVIDRLCLVWGKTCTTNGNCWLYDPKLLRYILNLMASTFVIIGSSFDVGVWYLVKDLKIFDEEVKETEMRIVLHKKEVNSEKNTEI